jgi:hypothetical protein
VCSTQPGTREVWWHWACRTCGTRYSGLGPGQTHPSMVQRMAATTANIWGLCPPLSFLNPASVPIHRAAFPFLILFSDSSAHGFSLKTPTPYWDDPHCVSAIAIASCCLERRQPLGAPRQPQASSSGQTLSVDYRNLLDRSHYGHSREARSHVICPYTFLDLLRHQNHMRFESD